MNEIYKQKAEKYKNKYLKLKQELYGGYEYEYNNCTSNPPIYFDLKNFYILEKNEEFDRLNDKISAKGKILIKEDYRDNNTININSYSNDKKYVGRLIKSKTSKFYKYDDEYEIEYENTNKNYKIINDLQITNKEKMLQYIPKIIYACRIKNDKSTTYAAVTKFFPDCTKSTNSTRYGYIITTNMGKNINVYMKMSDLIKFIPNLIDAIQNFIIPLNNANYFLNNIDLKNIYWNQNTQKVFFNISEMKKMTNKTENTDKEKLINSIRRFIDLVYLVYNNLNTNDDYYSLINALNEIKEKFIKLINIKITYNNIKSQEDKYNFSLDFYHNETYKSIYKNVYFNDN
jgi:hypothetical protein